MTKREDTNAQNKVLKPGKPDSDAVKNEPVAHEPDSVRLSTDAVSQHGTLVRVRLDKDQICDLNHIHVTLDAAQVELLRSHVANVKLDAEQIKILRSMDVNFNEKQLAALLAALTPSSPLATDAMRRLINAFKALER